jgi:signal transduction histidine kinase/CheY-like chemotaxis protein
MGRDEHEYTEDTTTLDVPIPASARKQTGEFIAQGTVSQDRAQLIILAGEAAGRTFAVAERAVIGRGEVEIRIQSDDASRRHASVERTPEGFVIRDLGSRNGTRVNGIPLSGEQPELLRFGDKIRIGGKTILMFTPYDRVEDQLLQSQKMESIGHLAGGVAHDFNNLLGSLVANLGFLRGLDRTVTIGNTDVQECLEEMMQATHRAAELTRQLLGFARRGAPELRPVEVRKLVEDTKLLTSRTFPRDIQLEVTLEPELYVSGDANQLHQVLMNLLINARDAMPKGGRITLAAGSIDLSEEELVTLPGLMPGSYGLISVTDTGSGMDERTRRRAFEPFFTTKPRGEGTGMGLAIVYGIVRNHGGHIEVQSEVGKGSSFRVFLPATAAPAAAGSVTAIAQLGHTRGVAVGLVLVVDDEAIVRKSTRRLLEGMGYGVLLAADGDEAVDLYRKHAEMVSLVLLDMIMPRMSGADTFHALREVEPKVKILLTSGYAEHASVRALIAAGAVGFLPKPYEAATIADAIKRALRP